VFETWARGKKGTPRPKRRAAALGVLATLALVVAGCGGGGGGGGDSESEAAARKKLEAAAAKIENAQSMRLSLLFEAEEGGDSTPLACLDLAVDTRKPESVDLTFYESSCANGTETSELIAIGRRAWGQTGPDSWREAKITPELLKELADEQSDFGELTAAAENIEVKPDGQSDERYSFEAPASAFPSSSELGDLKVEFEAVIDRQGYLRELVIHGDEDGAGATVTVSYDSVNEPQSIEPPSPNEVQGPVSPIKTRDQLDALFGLSSP
jgi:hypothetical protein